MSALWAWAVAIPIAGKITLGLEVGLLVMAFLIGKYGRPDLREPKQTRLIFFNK